MKIQNLPLCTLNEDGQPNPIAKMITAVLSSFAEIKRDNIKYRLNSGRELAKAKGVKMGRKVGSVKPNEQKAEEYPNVIKRIKKGQSIRNTAKLCGVSVSSVQELKRTSTYRNRYNAVWHCLCYEHRGEEAPQGSGFPSVTYRTIPQ